MKNYLGTPKFKTIDHSNHKLDFYNWSYFGYCQSKCTFSDHSWLVFFFFMTVENRESNRNSNRRPRRDRRAPNYTLGGAACGDLVRNRCADMRMCFSTCFSLLTVPRWNPPGSRSTPRNRDLHRTVQVGFHEVQTTGQASRGQARFLPLSLPKQGENTTNCPKLETRAS